ncbi:MAG: SNF2-related protein [Fusobacteriaceae bacterium]
MFRNIDLYSTYSTYDNNINEEFYIPVLSQSRNYDRAAVYFSTKSIASYMCGIENALENGFKIICSWLALPFDYSKITKGIETFKKLWNNQVQNIYVGEVSQVLVDQIKINNKGKIIFHEKQLNSNTLYLDLENGKLVLYFNNIDLGKIKHYKLKIKRYEKDIVADKILFKDNLTYIQINQIINILEEKKMENEYDLYVDEKLILYLKEKELHITKRENIGMAIKQKSPELEKEYQMYKESVNQEMSRELREQQMRDSFYMYTMKKCSNFSVPGSGKTSSVLGVFAYLSRIGKIDKLVMVGPRNSFKSWKDEFKICFNDKKLNLFSIQDYKTAKEKKDALSYKIKDKNLLLFNYESLNGISDDLSKIIDNKTLLVFDEVHKIKAIGGQRAELSLKVAKLSNYTIALTGTPIPNSYLDLKNILELLYKEEYQEQFGFDEALLRNPDKDDIEEINKKIQPFYCRTTKVKLGVPEPNENIIIESYSNSLENKVFKIILSKFRKSQFGIIIRLLQLQSNPKLLLEKLEDSDFRNVLDITATEEKIDFIDYSDEIKDEIKILNKKNSEKFMKCLELIKKLQLENKKVIVWCIFKDSIVQLEKNIKKLGIEVTTIYGEIEQDERENRLEKFKNENIQVLLTNPHTLAESVSLHHTCHDAIYFEYSYNLVHLLQSKDRIHRLGLLENQYTQYYFMQNNFTKSDDDFFNLDKKIYERLIEKEKIMINAIENDILEKVTTDREDIELILSDLLEEYQR